VSIKKTTLALIARTGNWRRSFWFHKTKPSLGRLPAKDSLLRTASIADLLGLDTAQCLLDPFRFANRRGAAWLNWLLMLHLIVPLTTFAAGSQPNVPPFVATGSLTVERLQPTDTNWVSETKGRFAFSYTQSNIWQVQFTYEHFLDHSVPTASDPTGRMIDFLRISGGTRFFIGEETNVHTAMLRGQHWMPSATTSPLPFPTMALQATFVPWLALCPQPELPFVDAGHIRFNFTPEYLNDPRNAGEFAMQYLNLKTGILARLDVTNNGLIFQHNESPVQLPEPYKEGYEQFSYLVLETTNFSGITFPLEAVFRQFAPLPAGKSRDDIYPAVVTHMKINQIDTISRALTLTPIPGVIEALDSRPTGLVGGITVNYLSTNDSWLSVTDKQLAAYANVVRRTGSHLINEGPKYYGNRVFFVSLLVMVTLIPIAVIILEKRHKQ
jgi:hypothetical protein